MQRSGEPTTLACLSPVAPTPEQILRPSLHHSPSSGRDCLEARRKQGLNTFFEIHREVRIMWMASLG